MLREPTDGRFHGFLWQRGRFSTLDLPGATGTSAAAINDRGQIVGTYIDADGLPHGFLRDGTGFTTIDNPGAALTIAYGINNRGQVVGLSYSDPADLPDRGFLLADGADGGFTPIAFPGAPRTIATGINDLGHIVGRFQNPAAALQRGDVARSSTPAPPVLFGRATNSPWTAR